MNERILYGLAADSILGLHCAFVAFVTGGLIRIWIGYFCRWRFVRNTKFRAIHLLAIGIVIVQTVLGQDCPLTVWEQELRIKAGRGAMYSGGCLEHWVHEILFYEAPRSVFVIAYSLFFILVCLTMVIVPPACWTRSKERRGMGRQDTRQKETTDPDE